MLVIEDYKIHHSKLDQFTDDEFYEFCVTNKDLHIERDSDLNIIIMSPIGGYSGFNEDEITGEIRNWRKRNSGKSFSSSTGFLLPNGAVRSPDGSWVSDERLATLTKEQLEKFIPLAPDFVVEMRSRTDSLATLKNKMQEWIENGVRLAWLIDPNSQQSYLYRADGSIEIVRGFDKKLNGEEVMPGFEFDLSLLQY